MANSGSKKLNALGEPLWVDILKTLRAFMVMLLLVAVVGGGLGIAIIAPWGRANPDCSIFCVIANKLKDPIEWGDLQTKDLTKDMMSEIKREMSYLSFSYEMPNYKQHRISLNNEQYENMLKGINNTIDEIKNPDTGKRMNIAEELYSKISSTDYKNIDDRYSKVEKIHVFKSVFENRKDIVLAKLYGIRKAEFQAAAEQGDANAQYNLALQYQAGKSLPKDPDAAQTWYTRAAEQGHAKAQYNLGKMYEEAQGISQDYKAAVKWYTKAAEYGHAHAQHRLGMMYFKGLGVPKDEKIANKWWKLSAGQGYLVDDKPEDAEKPK